MNQTAALAVSSAMSAMFSAVVDTHIDAAATVDAADLREFLATNGFLRDDPRFAALFSASEVSLSSASPRIASDSPRSPEPKIPLSPSNDKNLPQVNKPLTDQVLDRAFHGRLAIPDFPKFSAGVKDIFDRVMDNTTGGKVASYIPQLAAVDPNLFAVSFCSVDGQRFNFGDFEVPFSIQSCCKPVNYSIALEEVGAAKVHRHIGREPSGKSFNHMSLLDRKIPHNPMINAGAIMSSSLIQQGMPLYKRFGKVEDTWTSLFGGKRVSFNNSIYLSEKNTADRNYCLAYMMKEAHAFPEGTDLAETLEFYFQCCSLEADTNRMSIMAATYANGGVCPITGTQIFDPSTVRNTLSLMASCGMYDYSGEWNFRVGLPAKSGVSGAIWVVVPDVGGFCCYSPAIDGIGNSKRGVEFFQGLSDFYAFHLLEPARLRGLKLDPTAGSVVVDRKIGVSLKRMGRADSGRDGEGNNSGSGKKIEVEALTEALKRVGVMDETDSKRVVKTQSLLVLDVKPKEGNGVLGVPLNRVKSSSTRKAMKDWFKN